MKAACVSDYRQLAKKRVPHFLFEYLDGGSYGEITKQRNRTDLDEIALRQRVLRDISEIDLSVELFGHSFSMPVALAPIGLAGMYARRGETQAVRAAETAGVPFALSTVGVCPLQEVAAAASQPFWFQLYMVRDRAFMRDMLAQARAAGCSALIFTADMPVPGSRYRDYRSGLAGESWLSGNIRRTYQSVVAASLGVGCRYVRSPPPAWQPRTDTGEEQRARRLYGLDVEEFRSDGVLAGS